MIMKDIPGWEGRYAITDDGRIWCHGFTIPTTSRWGTPITKKYRKRWIATNGAKNGRWYISVALGGKTCRKGYKIHRLLAEAFIPNPNNLREVNHKNGDKTDNRLKNLEWCTRKMNMEHATRNGWMRGSSDANKKLTQDQADEIRKRYLAGDVSHRSLAPEYNVSFMTIGQIVRGRSYLHKDTTRLRQST